MSLTKVSYSMITGASVNVLDYGADPTGVANSSIAINAALAAGSNIYIPAGTYRIDSVLLPKTSQNIHGEGVNVSVLKAHTAGMTVIDYPSGSYNNINLSNFTVNGDSLAAKGINIISAAQGACSAIYLNRISVGLCTTNALYMSQVTYSAINDCAFSGGINTVYFNQMYSSAMTDSIVYDGSTASMYLSGSVQIVVRKTEFFNSAPASPADALVILSGCNANKFYACTFEAQGANGVVYEVELKGSISTENSFIDCSFTGTPTTKQNCIAVGTTGGTYHTVIQGCRFFKPALSSSILLVAQQEACIVGCTDLTTYDSIPFIPVTVTGTGDYFLEQLNGQFITAISAPSVSAQAVSTPLVNLTATVTISYGTGSPEGSLIAGIGSIYSNLSGGAGTTLYVKESGTGNTGWVAK